MYITSTIYGGKAEFHTHGRHRNSSFRHENIFCYENIPSTDQPAAQFFLSTCEVRPQLSVLRNSFIEICKVSPIGTCSFLRNWHEIFIPAISFPGPMLFLRERTLETSVRRERKFAGMSLITVNSLRL